jgi:Uma2 family endonuclease
MNPTKYLYGAIEARLAQQLGVFADERGLGVVMSGEVGIYTHRNPDTIRGADVLFISGERLARATLNSFLDVAPELVVEVLSPNDRWGMVKKKLREYFEIGVVVVLVVDPHERTVSVYRSLTQIAELGVGDALELPDVLPGFQLPLDKLFAA